MDEKKLAGLLGLSLRAGQLKTGTDAVVDSIRRGQAKLVLISSASSDNTRKKLKDACTFRNVPFYELEDGLIPKALGRDVSAAAVINGSFYEGLLSLLNAED